LPEGEPPAFETFTLLDKNPLGDTTKFRVMRKQNEAMRILQERLMRHLRKLKINLPFATGARPGNSPLRNMKRHCRNRYFFITDVQNAYPSVDSKKLAEILCKVDPALAEKERETSDFLKKYCFSPGNGLIIGASASPDLFNLYAGILIDRPLIYLCKRYSLTYTRYLDDLTFSSSKVPIGKRKRKIIRKIIKAAGFKISHRKSKVLDLNKGPIEINGVGLEYGGRIFLPRHFTRKINGLIHRAMTIGDIPQAKIHGIWGVFRGLTDRHNLNRTEQKLVKKYRAYCRFIKLGIKPT